MQNTAVLYSFIEPVARKHFGLGAKSKEAQFSKIVTPDSTMEPIREFQEDAGPTILSLKTENSAMATRNIQPGAQRRVQVATYAAAMEFSREILDDIRDSENAVQLRKVTTAAGAMGRASRLTPEYLWAQFMERTFNAAYPVTVDNVNLCSASHVSPLGTTYSNILATPAAFSETSLEDVKTQLRTTLGSDGLLTPVMFEQAIVPSALANIAEKIAGTRQAIGSANNEINVSYKLKYSVFDYLTNQTRWWAQTDADNGFYWNWRQKPVFERDDVANTMQAIFICFMRAMWGAEDPRCVIGVDAT